MKFKVKYRRATFTVEGEKRKKCDICGKEGKIDVHHMKYAYATKDVRKNKQLALDNTIQLCFRCHMVGDAYRIVQDNLGVADKIREKL